MSGRGLGGWASRNPAPLRQPPRAPVSERHQQHEGAGAPPAAARERAARENPARRRKPPRAAPPNHNASACGSVACGLGGDLGLQVVGTALGTPRLREFERGPNPRARALAGWHQAAECLHERRWQLQPPPQRPPPPLPAAPRHCCPQVLTLPLLASPPLPCAAWLAGGTAMAT